MDTELDPSEIVQIAEEIEYRRIRWYERILPSCADAASRHLCRELRAWSDQQLSRLTGLRARFGPAPPLDAATDRGDSLASNARLMAALAFFVAESSAPQMPTAVTCEWTLTDAINRSRQALVFYEGLKGFTRDRTAGGVMDEIAQQESDHLRKMLIKLESHRRAQGRGSRYLACIC